MELVCCSSPVVAAEVVAPNLVAGIVGTAGASETVEVAEVIAQEPADPIPAVMA